jgi:translation initiation factor IF-2
VEAKLDKGQGALATLIVNRGVLRTGQCIVAGTHWGKVRSIRAANREVIDMATPGKPVVVAGIKGVPMAGDEVCLFSNAICGCLFP